MASELTIRHSFPRFNEVNEASKAEPNVSVFIITYNEEINIERCLDSVHWSNDVVILDSFSQDRTIELAENYSNVRIFQREFDNFSNQRNFGLHNITYKNSWVMVMDADEEVEVDLAAEITAIAQRSEKRDVFLVRRWVIFENQQLRWNTTSGFWIERFIRPEKIRYEGIVHEKIRFTGPAGRLQGRLRHHQFSKGIQNWLNRRANYARLEASSQAIAKTPTPNFADLISSNVMKRRSSLKFIFQRMPFRWLVYFFYNFVFKFSYLDGILGLRYIYLESLSHYRSTN